MTGPRSAEERISLWLEEEAVGFLPDRLLNATFERTRGQRQASRSGWRSFSMSRPILALMAVGAAAVVIVASAIYFRPAPSSSVGGAPATTSPTASRSPTASPSPSSGPIDTSAWTPYKSSHYGFTIGYPAGWTATPATRDWTFEADAVFDPAARGKDHFSPADSAVGVSAWSVAVEPATTFETSEDVEAWVEAYCAKTDHTPCTGLRDRAVPLCLERRDCHPGVLVPFNSDVVAFFTNGAAGERMMIVAVWRSESDPSVAPFGGARRLLEGFLSTMCVWPEDARPPFEERIPGC
jgi:hypothetical protein